MMAVTPRRRAWLERLAKRMRQNPTNIELRLWNKIKNRQFHRLWFTTQEIIGCYVMDFYCEEKKLALEIDGIHHGWARSREREFERDFILEQAGVRILRIHSRLVEKMLPQVLARIELAAGVGRFAQISTVANHKELLGPVEKWKTFADAERERLLNGNQPTVEARTLIA